MKKIKEYHDIPTHDPYTGEINIDYEYLTGEINPLIGFSVITDVLEPSTVKK